MVAVWISELIVSKCVFSKSSFGVFSWTVFEPLHRQGVDRKLVETISVPCTSFPNVLVPMPAYFHWMAIVAKMTLRKTKKFKPGCAQKASPPHFMVCN